MKRCLKVVVQLALCVAVPTLLHAEKYALIAGVGQFLYLTGSNLDGARPDAEKMVETLMHYGFSQDKMIVLLDKNGTRDAILGGISQLAGVVKDGDQVVIYFSGHGTSSLDDNGGFGMDADTGGVVPADIKRGTKEEVLAQLIVGKRDLRPLLSRMEQKATVLVIFDSCFSGESVKAITVGGSSMRYISLADLTDGGVSSRSIMAAEKAHTRAVTDYPYTRVVYFSAASKNQPAYDINLKMLQALQGRFSTYDGLPHGAFTNVLLKSLSEGAGTSQGCRALFEQVANKVHAQAEVIRANQDPQFLFSPANAAQVDHPCLAASAPAQEPPPPGPAPGPSPSPSPSTGIREAIDKLAAGASFPIQCTANQKFYRPGENTILRCNLPQAGYLQVISYGMGDPDAVLLLPNRLQPNNAGGPGEVEIPKGIFNITNDLPSGTNRQEQVMLVLFSTTPQDARSLGAPAGIFTGLQERALRSQHVTAASGSGPASGYGAAELVFEIRK